MIINSGVILSRVVDTIAFSVSSPMFDPWCWHCQLSSYLNEEVNFGLESQIKRRFQFLAQAKSFYESRQTGQGPITLEPRELVYRILVNFFSSRKSWATIIQSDVFCHIGSKFTIKLSYRITVTQLVDRWLRF